jgi:Tol biopolymer transport system component
MSFDPTDPKWTAYVSDELDASEVAAVEREIESSPEAQEAVAGLRRVAVLLPLALDNLPAIELSPDQRSAIAEAARNTVESTTVRRIRGLFRVPVLAEGSILILLPLVVVFLFALLQAEINFEIETPSTFDTASIAVSPDGTRIAFVAESNGQPQLLVRSLNFSGVDKILTTEAAQFPFWSPDGRWIAFFSGLKLKKVSVDGGIVESLSEAPEGLGGAWNPNGGIMFAERAGLFYVPHGEGAPIRLTNTDRKTTYRFPQFLPDGRHFIYYEAGDPQTQGVYVAALDGRAERKRLMDADAAPVFASPDQLLFVRDGTLLAQRLDADRLELTGNPYRVAEHVDVDKASSLAAVSASPRGVIAYRTRSAPPEHQLAWFDRTGKEVGRVGAPDTAAVADISVSADGQWVALHRTGNGNEDIWTLNAVVDSVAPSTAKLPKQGAPVWSSDGRFLLDSVPGGITIWDLNGNRTPRGVRSSVPPHGVQLSPDGRWMASASNESGHFEIYLVELDLPGGVKWQVSRNGGSQPVWSRDAKELFYIAPDKTLMAVRLTHTTDNPLLKPREATSLFRMPIGNVVQGADAAQYAISPDGARFLIDAVTEQFTSPITIIKNYKFEPR